MPLFDAQSRSRGTKLNSSRPYSYIPGYDTHGLPLELKALSALKQPASSLTPQAIRAAARKEAEKGIEVQGEEFRSFCGIGAFDDKDAYKTMNWQYERRQLQVVREMVRKGNEEVAKTELTGDVPADIQSLTFQAPLSLITGRRCTRLRRGQP